MKLWEHDDLLSLFGTSGLPERGARSWQDATGETEFLLSMGPDTCQGSARRRELGIQYRALTPNYHSQTPSQFIHPASGLVILGKVVPAFP